MARSSKIILIERGNGTADLEVVKAKVQRVLVEDLQLNVMLRPEWLEIRLESAIVRVRTFKVGDGPDAQVLIELTSPL